MFENLFGLNTVLVDELSIQNDMYRELFISKIQDKSRQLGFYIYLFLFNEERTK